MNQNTLINLVALTVAILFFAQPANAQIEIADLSGQWGEKVNTVYTSIPFLRINPDARSGGMGDVGLATSPDAASMYWNASKLAFSESNFGVSFTYTPWLRELVDDVSLSYLSGYKKIGDNQSIGVSVRYFYLGNIKFNYYYGPANNFSPKEMAFDLAYARKLGDKVSLGLTLKYIYSNLAEGQTVNGDLIRPAKALAGDISLYYTDDILVGSREAKLSFGTAITNVGNKISYVETALKDFIPINLGVGSAFEMYFNERNSITFAIDINKLLVPTPDSLYTHRDKSVINGMLGSFGDAPGGAQEELQELMYSLGVEYWYNERYALRLGHYSEHQYKGNRQYATVGLGLKYKAFGLNASYLIPTNKMEGNAPLNNTMRLSLLFDFNSKTDSNS